jgi:hypothetical protein
MKYLKSPEFRERLIVDYLNVLNDQMELLEIRKLKILRKHPKLTKKFEKIQNDQSVHFTFNQIISQVSFEHLVNTVSLPPISEEYKTEMMKTIESINKFFKIIGIKIKVGLELLELVESKL